jgi:thiol-disulfide isomerase/thioredoxin
MKTVAIIGGIMVVILGIGYVVTSPYPPDEVPVVATPPTAADSIDGVEMETEVDTVATDTITPESADMMDEVPAETDEWDDAEVAGYYGEYSAEALLEGGADRKVVFFHASWCPSCRALDADIVANEDNIPDGVAIFKADYDEETALKQQFGVVRQHSVVVLDANGNPAGPITNPASFNQLLAAL